MSVTVSMDLLEIARKRLRSKPIFSASQADDGVLSITAGPLGAIGASHPAALPSVEKATAPIQSCILDLPSIEAAVAPPPSHAAALPPIEKATAPLQSHPAALPPIEAAAAPPPSHPGASPPIEAAVGQPSRKRFTWKDEHGKWHRTKAKGVLVTPAAKADRANFVIARKKIESIVSDVKQDALQVVDSAKSKRSHTKFHLSFASKRDKRFRAHKQKSCIRPLKNASSMVILVKNTRKWLDATDCCAIGDSDESCMASRCRSFGTDKKTCRIVCRGNGM